MGPLEMVKPWNTQGVEGVYRFLGRVWRFFVDEKSETAYEQAETTKTQSHQELLDLILLSGEITNVAATPAQLKTLHACIKKVTEDLDALRFNTRDFRDDGFRERSDDVADKAVRGDENLFATARAVRAASRGRIVGEAAFRIWPGRTVIGLRGMAEI
ncbi:MAG: hypothetical protein WDM76_19040 [Limisphaerales bacterium]